MDTHQVNYEFEFELYEINSTNIDEMLLKFMKDITKKFDKIKYLNTVLDIFFLIFCFKKHIQSNINKDVKYFGDLLKYPEFRLKIDDSVIKKLLEMMKIYDNQKDSIFLIIIQDEDSYSQDDKNDFVHNLCKMLRNKDQIEYQMKKNHSQQRKIEHRKNKIKNRDRNRDRDIDIDIDRDIDINIDIDIDRDRNKDRDRDRIMSYKRRNCAKKLNLRNREKKLLTRRL